MQIKLVRPADASVSNDKILPKHCSLCWYIWWLKNNDSRLQLFRSQKLQTTKSERQIPIIFSSLFVGRLHCLFSGTQITGCCESPKGNSEMASSHPQEYQTCFTFGSRSIIMTIYLLTDLTRSQTHVLISRSFTLVFPVKAQSRAMGNTADT